MKKLGFIVLLLIAGMVFFSCSINDDTTTDQESAVNDEGNNGNNDKDQNNDDAQNPEGDSEKPDIDGSGIYVTCTPGETKECFEGPSSSKNVGICKAGIATCVVDGTDWSECVGQILPEPEICGDGIDQDCNGEDTTEANVIDIDGDGFNYCNGDCCETTWECAVPERVGPSSFEIPENGIDDNCDGQIDELESCDTALSEDSTDPLDMAKSIELCPLTETKGYGLISAEILFPDGTVTSQEFSLDDGNGGSINCTATPPNPNSYAILSKFGNVITPRGGSAFFMMSSGIADDPIPASAANTDGTSTEFMCTRSNAPADWYTANGSQFPSSPGCGGLTGGDPGKEPLNDPVMLQVKVKVPKNAGSFSVDIYFFSREFPEYVCQYNDFFVALLDSNFTSSDINLQNPMDKNLARDEFNNPVGINLAKAGLFRACCNGGALACGYTPGANFAQFCTLGSDELAGTGLYDNDDKNGGTGWLITRGNVVPGEEITLRFAIWDALDHVLDSEIILDNFKWYESNKKPGTDDK
ncbi:MAG TPA: MopE-related protein [bacterium]|nr:MopE-related protein [bacterium]HPS29851.1 MopE-related protein [bacterium]